MKTGYVQTRSFLAIIRVTMVTETIFAHSEWVYAARYSYFPGQFNVECSYKVSLKVQTEYFI